jgi:hypothetical protein
VSSCPSASRRRGFWRGGYSHDNHHNDESGG